MGNGIIYKAHDVSRILGLPCKCVESPPTPYPGLLVLYYGGWTLTDLRMSQAGFAMENNDWYDKLNWKADPGYYVLLVPVPSSENLTWDEQIAFLKTINHSWRAAPVAVAATALLVHLLATGQSLLRENWCRCLEPTVEGLRVGLTIINQCLDVCTNWDGTRFDRLWLTAAWKP